MNYWYAVNGVTKEFVFVVGKNERPSEEHVALYLAHNKISWPEGSFRLVGDFDEEFEDAKDAIVKTHKRIEAPKPMQVREAYAKCTECNGAGQRWAHYGPDQYDFDAVDCDRCDGTGVVCRDA